MKLPLTLAVALFVSLVLQVQGAAASENAQEMQLQCDERIDYRQPWSILLTKSSEPGLGTVSMNDSEETKARFSVEGSEKRWDFGDNLNSFAIVVRRNGSALYYDFMALEVGDLAYGYRIFDCASQ